MHEKRDSLTNEQLLQLVGGAQRPSSDEFKQLVLASDSHDLLAKVFLLRGTPYVFEKSPMKDLVFREQVADRFGVGAHDVCIVGSAKLGFSPSPHKYGQPFDETSDVDVVIISEELFQTGSKELFRELSTFPPPLHEIRDFLRMKAGAEQPELDWEKLQTLKEAIRNYTYDNFNPGLLSPGHALRNRIFSNITSTTALFLALEPKVFVSRIRCRIFRTWRAAEEYYANSLRELRNAFQGQPAVLEDLEAEAPQDGELQSPIEARQDSGGT